MPKSPKASKSERAERALANYEKLSKKERENLGGGVWSTLDRAKSARASAESRKALKGMGLPEEAEEAVRGYAWEKVHGKRKK